MQEFRLTTALAIREEGTLGSQNDLGQLREKRTDAKLIMANLER
jgi:hypothetical protein